MIISGASLLTQNRDSVDALNVFPGPDGSVRIERVMNVKSVRDYVGRIDEMIGRKQLFFSANKIGEQ